MNDYYFLDRKKYHGMDIRTLIGVLTESYYKGIIVKNGGKGETKHRFIFLDKNYKLNARNITESELFTLIL